MSQYDFLSSKEYTAVAVHQLAVAFRAGLIDLDYARELLAKEFPQHAASIKRKRNTRSLRQRPVRRRPRSPRYQPNDLLTPEQAGKVLSLSPKTLANLRSKGGGPDFSKLSNRTIRYRYSDLKAFIAQSTKQNTSQYSRRV